MVLGGESHVRGSRRVSAPYGAESSGDASDLSGETPFSRSTLIPFTNSVTCETVGTCKAKSMVKLHKGVRRSWKQDISSSAV